MKVLIVEDDAEKLKAISQVVLDSGCELTTAGNVIEAKQRLSGALYDLLLLDLNLPKRADRSPELDGGLEIVRWLRGRGQAHRPAYLVGMSSNAEATVLTESETGNLIWQMVPVAIQENSWRERLNQTIKDIRDVIRPPFRGDGKTHRVDVLVVTALETPELTAILSLSDKFEVIEVEHDASRYYRARLSRDRSFVDVVAVAAVDKGMPAAAIAVSKGIQTFWPRYVYMPGITAGVKGRTGIADVIFADLTWDWGSGKIKNIDGKEDFVPAPYQQRLDVDLLEAARRFRLNSTFLTDAWVASPYAQLAPVPQVRVGVMASGASVLQSSDAVQRVVDQHKDLLAIEMEAFSVMLAASSSPSPRPKAIVAKAVCDSGDEKKDDRYQDAAAFTSAIAFQEFALKFLSNDADALS